MPLSNIADELLRILSGYEDGLSDDQVKNIFGVRYEQVAGAINELLTINRLQLFTQNGSLVYKAILEETAMKFEGLKPEDMLTYQAIERSGNKGIWTRDIKVATNIPQQTLNKCLKILEQRSLVKSVRSVVSKSKKLYILYDIMPAKEITGGPWYSDQEFDHEFVSELGNFVVRIVQSQGLMDLSSINEKVRISGISKIELSQEEIELVLSTLVYDGRLEEVQSSVLLMTGYATGKKMFKASRLIRTPNYLTETPCGVCPVMAQCCDGGVVSPTTCPYMTQWLDMQQDAVEDTTQAAGMYNW